MRGATRAVLAIALTCAVACAPSATRETPPRIAPEFAASFAREAVAADHALASEAGAQMLARGGNAVDAAVAASFCLSVVRPQSCGIGGGGFMVIRLPDHPRAGAVTTALNYRETCPAAIGPDFYETRNERDSRIGGAAVATPGTVAGLLEALERYGTLGRAIVLEPAIRAAREGFEVDAAYLETAREIAEEIQREPALAARFPFLWKHLVREGRLTLGERITNPAHARALELIALHGRAGFYDGELAQALVRAVQGDGGVLTSADLASYRVATLEPLEVEYDGRTLYTMPPPSSGGVVLAQTFAVLDDAGERVDLSTPWSAEFTQLYVESSKHSFADRARHLADPAFADVPLAQLLNRAGLLSRARSIDLARTHAPEHYGWTPQLPDDGGTSHVSVVDARGGAVACTETINLAFGSWLEVPGFGFLLNDEMDDFTTRRGAPNAFGLQQSDANLPAPGKRPLSSMTPTIAVDAHGAVLAVAGASGGPRIISGTLQALINVLVFDLPASEAVARARWHHQWAPDVLRHERAMDARALDAARSRGHVVQPVADVGVVQLIRRARSGAGWEAASDPRKGGRPAGR